MDFVMNHGGLFISIGVITLLALIGYYADKKESKNDSSNNNASKSTASSSPDVLDSQKNGVFGNAVLTDNVGDKSFSFDSTFYSPVQDSESLDSMDSVAPVDSFDTISESEPYGLNSFENVEMSLEDLEKKNYEKIASTSNSDGIDDYCYDDLDDAPISIVSVSDDDSSNNSGVVQSIGLDSNNTDLVDQQFLDLNVNNSDIVDEQSIDLSPNSVDSNNMVGFYDAQNNDNHLDDEVQSDVPGMFDLNAEKNLSDGVEGIDNSASSDSQVVPEIGGSDVVSDQYDLNNSTDDIWKF